MIRLTSEIRIRPAKHDCRLGKTGLNSRLSEVKTPSSHPAIRAIFASQNACLQKVVLEIIAGAAYRLATS
jgi:hypothetical protein